MALNVVCDMMDSAQNVMIKTVVLLDLSVKRFIAHGWFGLV